MHESLDEFKFRSDTDTNTRIICPCASEELLFNVVSTLAPSFLIGSSSYLQVTRTTITSRRSSKLGACIFDWIFFILAGNEDIHESLDEFKFRPDTDTNTRVICPCASEKLLYNVVSTLAPSFLIGSSSYLQVTRTSITSRRSSKLGQIGPRTAELAALERLEKSP